MKQKIYQVDAFTSKPFLGNPAAVCILESPWEDSRMQILAQEMNLSETAFLQRLESGYSLRWFTPLTEVDLCGHATLASAHILWETGLLDPDEEAKLHTRSGLLTAVRKGEWLEMNFPAIPETPSQLLPGLAEAVGVVPVYVGEIYFAYLILVESEEEVRGLQPNFSHLKNLTDKGVIVTSESTMPMADFVSRFFAPGAGIDEDPVTGSAHACLGPFWANRLGRQSLTGFQASTRGGFVRVHVKREHVLISGQAITVMVGELLV
jgi:PhzF family phenazine biosynthesis protein